MLKRYVSNRARLEGSIAEAYILKKCITSLSLYIDRLTIFSQTAQPTKSRRNDAGMLRELHDIAQLYLLYNWPELEPYLE